MSNQFSSLLKDGFGVDIFISHGNKIFIHFATVTIALVGKRSPPIRWETMPAGPKMWAMDR